MPENIQVESLTDEQMRNLNRLKEWILRKMTQARIDRERTERRERKEEELAKGEAEQSVHWQVSDILDLLLETLPDSIHK